MKIFLRLLLSVYFLSSAFTALATKLYWIGGSGNFNDPAHWSYESGGAGGVKSPSSTDDVYFDENSFPGLSVITFVGNTEVHDLVFSDDAGKAILSGLQNEKITINGQVKLNSYTDNQFFGEIHLTSSQSVTPVFFSLAKLKGSLYFDGSTTWNIQGRIVSETGSSFYLNQGTFNLQNAGLQADNIIAASGIAINAQKTYLYVANKLKLPAGVTLNDAGQSMIFAKKSNASLYQVDPSITFSSSSRLSNLNNTASSSCPVTNTSNVNPTCAGSCDGSMTFNIPAGCPSNPVYAVWSTGSGCTSIPTGTITPGSVYTVPNVCGCGTLYGVIFTNDPNTMDSTYGNPFNIPIADPIPQRVKTFTKISPTCFGYCNGMVIATLDVYGQNPFQLTWTLPSGSVTTHIVNNYNGKDTIFNACAGTYSVTIKDANGCITPQTFTTTLTQPTKVNGTPTVTNLLCNNVCTGAINNTTSGGTGALSCTINGASMPGCTASSLCAGTYTIITSDVNSCKDTDIVTITQPPAITFVKNPASGLLNINCNNTCDGSVGVTSVAGGTGAYTFSWTPAGGTVSSTANSSTYSGLCGSAAGKTYTCTIKDANNCSVTATFTVVSPPALSNTVTITNPKCSAGQGNSTGSATVTASGGSPAFTFSWTPSVTTGSASPTSTGSGMGPGTYSVLITDNKGCLDTASVTIVAPTALSGTMTTVTNPTCPNLNNGQMCVTTTGGTGSYTYTWTPSAGSASCTPSTLTVTPGGSSVYTVTVKDVNSCSVTVTATLTSPPQATVSAAVTNPPCAGTCNGSATLTPSGGTGPYTYQWSCSGSTTNTISNQCGGSSCNYTVTDVGTNCKYTGSLSFTVAPTLTMSVSSTTLTCSYSCNSTVTATPSGGTPGYSYSWSGSGVCATCTVQTNMCSGNYTVAVTDNLGCVITKTVAVTGPAALTNTVAVTNPKCTGSQGSTVGSATVTAGGGTANYTFVWTPTVTTSGASPKTIGSNMSAGTYSVFITDANGCQDTTTVTLSPPTAVSGSITTTTNPTCPNLNNGQLCVTPSGGTGPYTYTWSPTGGNASCSAATLTVSPGGTSVYTVTIKDANSCTVTVTGTLTSPPQATVASAVTNASCGSSPCTASATLTPSGGTGPFTYQWSCSGSTTNTISNQCAGTTCNYTVTDAGTGCKYPGSVTFAPAPPTLSVTASATALSCSGNCSSVITTTVNGGTAGYTYSWSGTGANPVCPTCTVQSSMCVGNYTVIVTDNLGCTKTATVSISSPPALTVTLNATQPSCNSSCDGSISTTITGGSAPYPGISWSPSTSPNPPNSTNPTGLCGSAAPGTVYTLTVTDNNGCQGVGTATLVAPPSLTVTVNTTSITCSGLCNGSATATATGGTPGYTYSWDNGSFGASATASGLCVGSHSLVVKDSKSCLATAQIFNIAAPNPMSVSVININNTCGPCTGSADANVTNGTPGYTYTWSPAGGNGASASGLCIGNYTLTVSDTNSCPPVSATFTISPIVVISISATSQSVSCNGSCDGIVSATASAGLAPYTMTWSVSPTYTTVTTCNSVSTCSVGGLCAGTYIINAVDQNGCVNKDSVVIGNPPVLTATVATTNATCFGACSGSATVTPSGGASPYTVTWSNGATGPSVTNLCPGPYTYTVIDNRGCTVVQSFTLNSSSQLSYTSTSTTPIACNGTTGSVQVTASGGSSPYTFTWTPVGTGTVTTTSPTSTLSGVAAGVFTVTITDSNGCDTTVQITLSDPGSPSITPTTQSVSCFNSCDGSATVTATGTGVITLTWPGGTPTGPSPIVATNLCIGTYAVQATDGNGCNAFQNVTISGPPQITDNPPTVVNPNCLGNNGSITVTPGGGSGSGYTFNWDGGAQNTNPATGLSAGVHTLVITDGTNCSQTFNYTLTTTSTPTITVTPSNTQCSYLQNGSANASVNGGVPTYTYTWSSAGAGVLTSGPNVTNVANLPADSYTVSVTDAGGCTSQQTFTITSPAAIAANATKADNLCSTGCTGSATVAPTGGTGTYTVSWSPGAMTTYTVNNLCPQTYTVILTDGNNCKDTSTVTIVQPPALTVTPTETDPLCNGASTGSATLAISGGTPGYNITWAPNICANCTTVTNLGAGSYTATVLDTNGCSNAQIITVSQPSAITPNTSTVTPLCTGDCNGSITSSTTGGTGAYTYTWSASAGGTVTSTSTSSTYTNLCQGTYTLITNDANGCADTSTATIANPQSLSLAASATSANCGQTNGSITISNVTGTGTVSVQWLNPATCGSSLSCNNLGFGVYSVELTDANGCKDTFFVAVNNPNGPQIDSALVNDTCFGFTNGSITVNVTNGVNQVTPYTFSWTPTGYTATTTTNSSTYSGLPPGGYISTVTDSLGCGTATSFTVTEPPQIQDNGNSTNATCLGINDGSIHSVASGGTPGTTGYNYTLDGTTTNSTGIFTGLAVGVHTVCIGDSINCQQCFTYTVNPNTAILSQISSTNIKCNGNCNGTATLSNVNGGAAPYVISWSDPNSQSGVSAMNLCPGTYTATITDTNGCMATQAATITEPGALTLSSLIANPTCGQCDGAVAVTPSGGTPSLLTGYSYTWTPSGAHTQGINNVCAGIYQVNVTDSVGCMQSFQVPVSNSSAPSVTVTSTSPACGGTPCSGSATVTASGGVGPYTYSWPVGGQTGTSISNQCAGLYFVQVKDSAGCIATDSALIAPGVVLSVTSTMVNPPCNSCTGVINASVSGGSGNYSYSWPTLPSTNDTITNLCAGNYTLVVTDNANGCQDTTVIGLNNNSNGPVLVFATADVLCNGSCNGTATVTASGGTPGYDYQWNSNVNDTTANVSGLCPGTYAVLVTDVNGCIQTGQVTISQPNPMIASTPITAQPNCFGDCNGSITTVVSGGTPNYQYAWSPSTITGSSGTNLCAGNYSVTVTDTNGCQIAIFDTLTTPPALVITGTVSPASCSNVADGAINTTTTGGTPNYTWQWSGGSTATSSSLSNILVGNYTVVATDSKNCTDTASFAVVSTVTITANAGNDTTACSLGQITLNGTVSAGATVQWIQLPNPPGTVVGTTSTVTITPPLDSTFYVLVAQNSGCSVTDTMLVVSDSLPTPDAGTASSIFTGYTVTIGGAPTNPSGGVVAWTPSYGLSDTTIANPIANPTVTTTYTVYETNSHGCVAWDTVTVTILPTFIIPNGFSPNGDGWNDVWQIDLIYLFPDCEVEVFNRWGEPLFYSKGYNTPWNGTYNGKPVPVGTYYYLIRLHDKEKKFPDHYTGPLTILR